MDAAITKTNPLGTERIGKLIVTFAVPGIISMVVNACTTLLTRFYRAGGRVSWQRCYQCCNAHDCNGDCLKHSDW